MRSLFAILIAFWCSAVNAATTSSITQGDITWTFDQAYEFGQFANGDYWIVGPATITAISPAYNGTINGWEVNPDVSDYHGFAANSRYPQWFDSDRVPSLPYTTTAPIESIVKVVGISGTNMRPAVKYAAVLTVLSEAPADPSNTFRPPYVATTKPLYTISDVRTDLLPTVSLVGSYPTLAQVAAAYSGLRLDHVTSNAARSLRPSDFMEDYTPKNTEEQFNSILRLFANESFATKRTAFVHYFQMCLDKAYAVLDGYRAVGTDGHNPGHKIQAMLAAEFFDITAIKAVLLASVDEFHEDVAIYAGVNTSLWGFQEYDESEYWGYIAGRGGNRAAADPYGLIDGGDPTAGNFGASQYQYITVQNHKGTMLVMSMIPSLMDLWDPGELSIFQTYVERWMTYGNWYAPDDAAPYDGSWANYGTTYGPDGGGYHTGAGRFPSMHGGNPDTGQYRSDFVAAMWDAYYGEIIPTPDPDPEPDPEPEPIIAPAPTGLTATLAE